MAMLTPAGRALFRTGVGPMVAWWVARTSTVPDDPLQRPPGPQEAAPACSERRSTREEAERKRSITPGSNDHA